MIQPLGRGAAGVWRVELRPYLTLVLVRAESDRADRQTSDCAVSVRGEDRDTESVFEGFSMTS